MPHLRVILSPCKTGNNAQTTSSTESISMRYVTVTTERLTRLLTSINALIAINAETLGEEVELPSSPSEAWDAEDEGPVLPLGCVRIYYQKIHNPNADDYRPRMVVPIEAYESKAGDSLMRAYDYQAGFVKSFRLDAIQRIGINNQNLKDDDWGVTAITFRAKR